MKPVMRGASLALVFVLIFVLPARAGAADLLEVYRDARAYDATYAAALAAREAGREKLDQGRALVLPSVNVTANAAHTNLDARYDPSPLVPPIDKRNFNTNGYALTLTQPIYRRQNFIQYSEADYLVQQSEATFAAASQDLILRVAQAYFDVLAAQDTLTLVRAQKAAISEQLAQAKQNFEVGTTTITDTHEAQARYDLINAQEIAAQSDLEIKQRTLVQLTGKSYAVLEPLREKLGLAAPKPDELSRWLELGDNQSYVVLVQQAQVELQALEVKRNRAGHYPTLDFVASYGTIDQTGTILAPISGQVTTGSVGLQFSMPLYAGGAVQSRTREAQALHDKARADLDNVRRRQALAVQQSFVGVISGFNQVQALEQAQTSSESALASNKLGYEVGVRVNIDVLNAQQQLYSTRRDLATARYNTILSQLRLKAAVGGLTEEDLAQVNGALAASDSSPITR